MALPAMLDVTNAVCRLRSTMSGENLRNVPVRRNIRSGSASDTVTESHEHDQGDVQGVAEPEDTGRGGERIGEETRRCTQGVLWRECIALYNNES